jgi:hypothetical protein
MVSPLITVPPKTKHASWDEQVTASGILIPALLPWMFSLVNPVPFHCKTYPSVKFTVALVELEIVADSPVVKHSLGDMQLTLASVFSPCPGSGTLTSNHAKPSQRKATLSPTSEDDDTLVVPPTAKHSAPETQSSPVREISTDDPPGSGMPISDQDEPVHLMATGA